MLSFLKQGGRGRAGERVLLWVSTKVCHLPQAKVGHLLQPDLDAPHPRLEQACTTMFVILTPAPIQEKGVGLWGN